MCLNTGIWLPVFGIFNMRTDVNAGAALPIPIRVCRVFMCLNTGIWQPVFGIFNMRTDLNAGAALPIPIRVCRVFMCLNTGIWLPMFRIFNMHADLNAYSFTAGLHGRLERVCTRSRLWEKNPWHDHGLKPAVSVWCCTSWAELSYPHPLADKRLDRFENVCIGVFNGRSCHKYYFRRDKTGLLSWQKYACHKKSMPAATKSMLRQNYVATNICGNKRFVMAKIFLPRQTFCHKDKHTFVTTKDVLCHDKTHVCRNRNDTCGSNCQWYSLMEACVSKLKSVHHRATLAVHCPEHWPQSHPSCALSGTLTTEPP